MKFILGMVLGALLAMADGASREAADQPAGSIRVVSCNLRGALIDDGPDSWEYRKESCLEILKEIDADIMCFQELQTPNREALEEAFPDYCFFGALDRPAGGHPMNGILYRRSAFKLLGSGGYALSDHPHLSGSIDWNHSCPRFVNYLILEEKTTGRRFRIVNTHLDHESQIAREKGAALINEESAVYDPAMPQILAGDMNCMVSNPAVRALLAASWQDSFFLATGQEEPGRTFHAFQGRECTVDSFPGKIDFILVRGALEVTGAEIVDRVGKNGRYPSDHFFVEAVVRFR
ncbi:endonuclease/exonuclease/phosphatase family protein [Victivallis sp. Marseille-Q1083]|uniref:endonuclease/exonuclease/phosphatase family protein n=1 Tax=Victivallis sp. Marseille-Q1083 TaxID=2717288 RepID=UPI00158DC61D|nr:endonuclease/exonuclease/phosphatase family protein [Victivallis sp. Marseille-Q1083]